MNKMDLFTLNEITISYTPRKIQIPKLVVDNSASAHHILKTNWSDDIALCENFNILLLDNQCQVLGISNIAKGGLNTVLVDLRLAFATALKSRSVAMILSHNHPCENIKPSQQDIELTKRFMNAGKVLDIKVLDHIILTPSNKYFSFADEELIL